MKKLMLTVLFSSGIVIPFAESTLTNSQARQLIDVDCVEFKNYRNLVDEREVKLKELEIQRQLEFEAEQERLRQEELERQRIEEEKNKLINKLGYEPSKTVEVNCKVTFYYADSNKLQGGFNDKKGVPLKSHNEPIVALPSDVPYGSYIEFDKAIRGYTRYKCVDTGGAIKWLDSNTIVVDVFVPEASIYNELINMVKNTTTTATIYYK